MAQIPMLPETSLGALDLLGRMPIPIRRPFRYGLDRVLAHHRWHSDTELRCYCLGGGDWSHPFDQLNQTETACQLPKMLLSTVYQDILSPSLRSHYGGGAPSVPLHPACEAAQIADPEEIFQVVAVIPFVWLVDLHRLGKRPAPSTWADLLDPCWAGEITLGGWRAHDRQPYQDCNAYLLMALEHEWGTAGLEIFANNVIRLQHNARTSALAGSNSARVGTIAILPWLQAAMSPRRQRLQVIWPQDGALVMPMGYMLQSGAAERLTPIQTYLTSPELATMLARNGYPSVVAGQPGLPSAARVKWPGWPVLRRADFSQYQQAVVARFFAAHRDQDREAACN